MCVFYDNLNYHYHYHHHQFFSTVAVFVQLFYLLLLVRKPEWVSAKVSWKCVLFWVHHHENHFTQLTLVQLRDAEG